MDGSSSGNYSWMSKDCSLVKFKTKYWQRRSCKCARKIDTRYMTMILKLMMKAVSTSWVMSSGLASWADMGVMWSFSWKNMTAFRRCFRETRGEGNNSLVGNSTILRTLHGTISIVTSKRCQKELGMRKKCSWWTNSNQRAINVTTAFHWLG